MKRYTGIFTEGMEQLFPDMEPSEYVLYSDHQKETEELRELLRDCGHVVQGYIAIANEYRISQPEVIELLKRIQEAINE